MSQYFPDPIIPSTNLKLELDLIIHSIQKEVIGTTGVNKSKLLNTQILH